MRLRIQLLALEHCWSISTGSCLTTHVTALILLRATTTCLTTWRTGCDHSASTIMRSWLKVWKRGWDHRRKISLTQAYKELFPDTNVSVRAATTWKVAQVCTYFFAYNICFLIASFINSLPEVTFRIDLVILQDIVKIIYLFKIPYRMCMIQNYWL
jgi:hypothetical protein